MRNRSLTVLHRAVWMLLLAVAPLLSMVARPLPLWAASPAQVPPTQGAAQAPAEESAAVTLLAYFESDVLETAIADLVTTLAFFADGSFELTIIFPDIETTLTLTGTYAESEAGVLLTALTMEGETLDEVIELELLWDADDTLVLVGGFGDELYADDIIFYAADSAAYGSTADGATVEIPVGGVYLSSLITNDDGAQVLYVLNLVEDGSASLSSDYLDLQAPSFELGAWRVEWSEEGEGVVTLEFTGTPEEEYEDPIVVALQVGETGELTVGTVTLYPLSRFSLTPVVEEAAVEILATYVTEIVGEDEETLRLFLALAADGSFTLTDEEETNTVYGEWALGDERLTLTLLGDQEGNILEPLELVFEFGEEDELILVEAPADLFEDEDLIFYPLE